MPRITLTGPIWPGSTFSPFSLFSPSSPSSTFSRISTFPTFSHPQNHQLTSTTLNLSSIHFRKFSSNHVRKPISGISDRIGQGSLYAGDYERDACGVGLLAHMKGDASRDIVTNATEMLTRMAHRGGCGCEKNTGDGAGMLVSMPDAFLRRSLAASTGIKLPPQGQYGAGVVFFSVNAEEKAVSKDIFQKVAETNGMEVLAWRPVPTENGSLGDTAKASEPDIEQVFLREKGEARSRQNQNSPSVFDRELFRTRKLAEVAIRNEGVRDFYVCSLSSRTMTYKGQLTPDQLSQYFADLRQPDFIAHMALVHSRFSTNTFPSWDRAQPNRMLCHNGEINTLRGNKNWMEARSRMMVSPLLDAEKQAGLLPICSDDMTDSGNVDSVLELLTRASDRTIAEAMMMLIPEAWQNNAEMTEEKRAFYAYNSCVMEPWDGPAMMAFTDGRYLGACLDRNGLRPSRYYVTHDDLAILSSEVGVLPQLDQASVKTRGRLEPGKMFLIDFDRGGLVLDEELKHDLASRRDYGAWVKSLTRLDDVVNSHTATHTINQDPDELSRKLTAFGYTTETLDLLLAPMGREGKEALGSMGVDTPLAVLSEQPRGMADYFKQLFAQVTNPPIDPIREEIVMSLQCPVGPEGNLLDMTPQHAQRLILDQPVLSLAALEKLLLEEDGVEGWHATLVECVYEATLGEDGLRAAIDRICEEVATLVEGGAKVVVLAQAEIDPEHCAVPSLMAVGAVHHHLIKEKLRTQVALVVDAGDAKEVHDFCTLVGFGADAVCPSVAYAALCQLNGDGKLDEDAGKLRLTDEEVMENYRNAIGKGMLKVMAKMGISTLQSYKGAQIFEAVGLDSDVVNRCFVGCTTRIEGAGFEAIAADIQDLHSMAYQACGGEKTNSRSESGSESAVGLRNPGDYHYRHGGEHHLNDPRAMTEMQFAVRHTDPKAWQRYTEYTMEQHNQVSLRGLLDLNVDPSKSISIDDVEPVEAIMKRFVTGAMSLGSISAETHETLAIAMNRIGGRSNTGEGGEDPQRFVELPTGDSKRSAIKQVASGRFGVTAEYLANADQVQIKMAQGAKPGEGGELPGYKVTEEIASVRGTTPGVGLISPPPHHDIYSIEDLAQLIFDLKNAITVANPTGTVSVKLVSEVGVGIVAAGVAKAKADHITISGGDGGTGAAAWTGIQRAGLPWELGLAETQQTLLVNDLRNRVRLQVDGQIKTGRDVVVAAMLGAEEFGFSTAPLIALGCIMMRKCHLNTCPVGIATQDPELRRKFAGQPEHVQNFFYFLAEDVRQYMSLLGVSTFVDLIGTVDYLRVNERLLDSKSKAKGLDLSPLLIPGRKLNPKAIPYHTEDQDHELETLADHVLISKSAPALRSAQPVFIQMDVNNLNRAFGTQLSTTIAKAHGSAGLPHNTIHISCKGSGGQSMGFLLAKGITLELEGDANDYIGKSLCGGKIIVYPHKTCLEKAFVAEQNVIIGNVALYGATSGEAYFRGIAGERFCVRNSGATAVVEGVGDHGCEYMTGGRVVVLGPPGRNFAAGMSGGIAYVYDPNGALARNVNMDMVALEDIVSDADLDELRLMVENHRRYTASAVAAEILNDWPRAVTRFVKVMPNDYKRVLTQMQQAQATQEPRFAHS